MKPIIKALLAAAVVPGAFWSMGFDFDKRGGTLFWCYLITGAVGGLVYGYNKKERW